MLDGFQTVVNASGEAQGEMGHHLKLSIIDKRSTSPSAGSKRSWAPSQLMSNVIVSDHLARDDSK